MIALVTIFEWFNLGMYLGVKYFALKKIEKEQMGQVEACKREMLAEWLSNSDDPTKQQLIKALWRITRQ